MARGPCSFKQRDLTRALKGAKAAGFDHLRVEVELGDGNKMVVIAGNTTLDMRDSNPWDEANK
jgi:hypothetical protein